MICLGHCAIRIVCNQRIDRTKPGIIQIDKHGYTIANARLIFNDNCFAITNNTIVNQFNEPANINYCLYITDAFGCADSSCVVLTVIPADIENINIITANADGINDTLYFQYLDFYPQAHLVVLNRWGQTVYESLDYKNDWTGAELVEGTYFYKLLIPDLNKTLQSFFELKR